MVVLEAAEGKSGLLPARSLLQPLYYEQRSEPADGTIDVVLPVGCHRNAADALHAGSVGWPQLTNELAARCEEIETIHIHRKTAVADEEAAAGPLPPGKTDRVERAEAARVAARKPYLPAGRGPGEALRRRPTSGQHAFVSIQVHET